VLEVICNDQACKDLDEIRCPQSTWQNSVQNAPMLYTHTLAIMSWTDKREWLQMNWPDSYKCMEIILSPPCVPVSLLWTDWPQKMVKQADKGRSYSCPPTKASAIKSSPFSVQGRGQRWCTPCASRGSLCMGKGRAWGSGMV